VDTVDKHLGIQCESWSNDPAQHITHWNSADYDENYRLAATEQILIEPFPSGIDDAVTAGYREH